MIKSQELEKNFCLTAYRTSQLCRLKTQPPIPGFQPTFRRSLSKVDNIGDKLVQGSEESIFVHH